MRIALVGAELEENLAIRYIWAALKSAGHDAAQVVFNGEGDLERAAREIAESGAQLAGFSMVFTYRAREFADLAARARELGFRGHIVAGGHFAAFNAEALLQDEPGFDSIAIGEGEEIICALAENLENLPAVRGLVWRKASHSGASSLLERNDRRENRAATIVRNAPAIKPPELDALPRPVRKQPPDEYLGLPIANMLASRGCTHACAFCSIAAWHQLCGGERFRVRAPESVAAEIAELYRGGYRIFNFHDDNFFLHDTQTTFKRVRALDRELGRRGVGRIAFAVKARPDNVDRELFKFLQEMGMFRVFLGIEAGTADALKHLGRGQTLQQNERALETVNSLDLHCCFNLLLLNPESTLEDFRANIEFLRAHPHNPMNFCRTEVYAGTPLERKLRAEGRLLGDYWAYSYHIKDKRAQLAFALIHAALFGRHHADGNAHQLTMSVDYEHAILKRFFRSDRALRQRVKDHIVRVNLDACELLSEIADAAARGFDSDTAWLSCVGELDERVRRGGDDLNLAARELLIAVRDAAAAGYSRDWRGLSQEAAALALTATLAFSAHQGTAAEEPAHESEMVAAPTEADAKPIIPQFKKEVLPKLALQMEKPTSLRITLLLGGDGAVWNCTATDDRNAPVVAGDLRSVKLTISPRARQQVYRFNLTEAEVAEGRKHVYDPPEGAAPPEGNSDILKGNFEKDLLRAVCAIRATGDVELELWFGDDGKVRHVGIFRAGGRVATEVTEEDRKKAVQWLQELGNDDFTIREKASAALQKLGVEVTPLLRKTLEQTTDPEVKSRCETLLTAVNPALTGPGAARAVATMRSLKNPAAAGKRFIVSFGEDVLEQAYKELKEESSHMFERAPAPRPPTSRHSVLRLR